ncbi:TonB-dependent receptor [Acinetobacter larvae]|uniref:Ferric anguibactin receptor n=1 Tax=Acinetobacter larvae TaxID=1789224 RepID=A0A1B2LXT7_9GAMM|nr:TonB-dependent receptor [Acinetobacter larvae]AOA57757.1 ferric anguibactin receptor [Acinetobacter larvae]
MNINGQQQRPLLKPLVMSIHFALCGVALGLSAMAHAEQHSPTAHYQISKGSLGHVLNQFALQAGVKLAINADLVAGLTSQGLQGNYSIAEGFATLLKGTPLQVTKTANGYVLTAIAPQQNVLQLQTITLNAQQNAQNIQQPTASVQASDASALPTIVLTAQHERQDLPPAFAGGQAARGARVGVLGEKDFMETPFNIMSYTSDYIQNSQSKDITGIIAKTDAGVYSSGSAGGISESYSIRGFGVSTQDVSINGLYGVSPYWRASPEFAERVEVLKGPSALLNGMPPNGSVGGAINMVTKRATEAPIKRLTASYDSDAKFGVHTDLATRFGDEKQFGIRFNGVYRDGDTAVKNQSASTKFASLGLDWKFDRGSLSADLYHSEDRVDGLNRGISIGKLNYIPKAPKAKTVFAPKDTFTDTTDDVIILRGDYQLHDNISAYATYGHSQTDFDSLAGSKQEIINDAGDFTTNYSHQRLKLDKDSSDVGIQFNFNTFAIQHDLIVNATWYQHEQKFGFRRNFLTAEQEWTTNMYAPNWDGFSLDKSFSSASLPKTAEVRNTSVGLTDSMSMLNDRLNLIVGLRQQRVKQDAFDSNGAKTASGHYNQSKLTPAVALLFKTSEHLSVYANYIEGLSVGSTAPATADNAGEVFPPFQTKQYEVGTKLEWGDFANTLSLYQIEKPSAITDPITNIYNADGEQRNRGVEWGFFGKALPDLKLMGGIAYTEAKLTKTQGGVNQGNYASATPKWQAKLGAEYDLPWVDGLSINANAVALSKQYISNDNVLSVPGRTIYDIGARYQTHIGQIPTTVRADIKNVANKAYWASSPGSGLGAPRTVMLSTSFDF